MAGILKIRRYWQARENLKKVKFKIMHDKLSNISFVLFSYNEEKRIEYIIRNLKPFGQVYVLDGGSTDNTKKITEEFGGIFSERPKIGHAHVETEEMFEFVKKLVPTSWVYWGYVDNLLPKTLLEKMREISLQEQYKFVYVPVWTYLWGDTKHPIIKASYTCFFRKEYMDFKNNHMHGMGKFMGKKEETLHLPMKDEYAMRHFSLYNLEKYVTGHLRYALAEAELKHQEGKKFSLWYMFGSMAHYFWLFYKRGFKAGIIGLYSALLYIFFRLMVAVRLYEYDHNLDLNTIEAEFAKVKKQIVQEAEGKIND